MKKIIIDLDDTLTINASAQDYADKLVDHNVRSKLVEYKNLGFEICIYTARNMRSLDGDIGKINKHTVPVILKWLEHQKVPFDELIVGKPWCGTEGFYVDDKAIRPSEFVKLTYDEITKILEKK